MFEQYPEVVSELKDILLDGIRMGRTTPGEPQKNESEDKWPQLKALVKICEDL